MELVRNIFFNTDKIVENTDVKVTYAGNLYQHGAEDVVMHYGFGTDWNNSGYVPMEKTELGYQATVHVCPSEKINFCFKNSKGEWDNNNGYNYGFKIEGAEIGGYHPTGNSPYAKITADGVVSGNPVGAPVENPNYIKDVYSEVIAEKKDNVVNNGYVVNEDVPAVVYNTPSWGELLKKTFNDFVNYFSKLFGKSNEGTNNN